MLSKKSYLLWEWSMEERKNGSFMFGSFLLSIDKHICLATWWKQENQILITNFFSDTFRSCSHFIAWKKAPCTSIASRVKQLESFMHLEEENQISENMRNVYSGVPQSSNYSLILLTGTLWVWEAKVTTTPGISFRPFFFFCWKRCCKSYASLHLQGWIAPLCPNIWVRDSWDMNFPSKKIKSFHKQRAVTEVLKQTNSSLGYKYCEREKFLTFLW